MLFHFFSKKKKLLPDFSFLGCDIHSHVLPGIDDGAATKEESLELIKKLNDYGISEMVCTPHIQFEFFKNTPTSIVPVFESIKKECEEKVSGMKLHYAAEYLLDDGFMKIKPDDLLTFGQGFILIELSYYSPFPDLSRIILYLKGLGYRIILAHPERYSYWYNDMDSIRMLKDSGVYFQVNLISVGGHFGEIVQQHAEAMLSQGLIDFAATDLHHERHFAALEKALYSKSLYRAVEEGQIKNKLIWG